MQTHQINGYVKVEDRSRGFQVFRAKKQIDGRHGAEMNDERGNVTNITYIMHKTTHS